MKKSTYLRAHDQLMAEMRTQLRLRNLRRIKETSRRLHRLRARYRARFAS